MRQFSAKNLENPLLKVKLLVHLISTTVRPTFWLVRPRQALILTEGTEQKQFAGLFWLPPAWSRLCFDFHWKKIAQSLGVVAVRGDACWGQCWLVWRCCRRSQGFTSKRVSPVRALDFILTTTLYKSQSASTPGGVPSIFSLDETV